MLLDLGIWVQVKDGDADAFALFQKHYSFQRFADGRRNRRDYRNRRLFMGPGEKLVLMTPDAKAIFGWRRFIDKSGQHGVNCAVFRNEGSTLSSELILAAESWAWDRWPGERLYTFVSPEKTKRRRGRRSQPGQCFIHAGWLACGETKGGLAILEKWP